MNASSFDFETGRGLEASRECGEAVVGRGNAEASVGVSAPTRESSGRPWPPGDPRGDARVRPRSHERGASHRARPSIPKAEKNKRENWRAGANLPRSRRRVVRVLTCPRPSFRSGRCRWPGVPPACRTPTFRWTTLFSRALAGVRGRRSPIKKRACDLSRNSNFALPDWTVARVLVAMRAFP